MGLQSISEGVTTTVDNTDALVNTGLATAPGPGAIGIWLASTAADSRAIVTVGGRVLKNDSVIEKVGTDAQIDTNADAPLATPVRGGEKIKVNLDVVTAGTVRVLAVFHGLAL